MQTSINTFQLLSSFYDVKINLSIRISAIVNEQIITQTS